MKHSSVGSIRSQVWLAKRCWRRHSKSKPHLVSPMFKCMESQSVHVIEIIKNGYNPKERPEPIFWYQPSRSFGVSLAFSNLVMCPSTQMHIDVLLGSEQAAWKLSSQWGSKHLSWVSILEVTAKACGGQKPSKTISIHFRPVLHSWAEDTQLGARFCCSTLFTSPWHQRDWL